MARKRRYKQQEVIDALNEGKGYVSKVASLLGCAPVTVYDYAKRFPKIRETWDGIRESRHDFVENKLHGAINSGNVTAMIFYLKTQAKDRGYVERQEVTGKDGGELTINVNITD